MSDLNGVTRILFHKPKIFIEYLTSYVNNELVVASVENYPGVEPAFKSDLPEVESFARLYNIGYKNNGD